MHLGLLALCQGKRLRDAVTEQSPVREIRQNVVMGAMVIGFQFQPGPGDVLVGAIHDERLARLIPFPNFAAVQDPDPMSVLVTHAGLVFVERRFAREVLLKQFV